MSATRGFSPDAISTAEVDFGVTRDGFSQLRRRWMADHATAAVVLVHGIGEHSGRYEHVGCQFRAAGIHTIAYDHRGFGESGGVRAYVDRFSQYVDDLEDQLRQVRLLGLPTIVIGHSLGGLIAASHAVSSRPHPDRLVLSGPALEVEASALLRSMAGFMARLAPRREMSTNIDSSALATDPRVGRAYDADPLVHRKYTLRLGAELLAEVDRVRGRHDRLSIPTLVLHGLDDSAVLPAASEAFGSLPTAERRVYPGLRHEIFNEPSGPEIIDEIIAWI